MLVRNDTNNFEWTVWNKFDVVFFMFLWSMPRAIYALGYFIELINSTFAVLISAGVVSVSQTTCGELKSQ